MTELTRLETPDLQVGKMVPLLTANRIPEAHRESVGVVEFVTQENSLTEQTESKMLPIEQRPWNARMLLMSKNSDAIVDAVMAELNSSDRTQQSSADDSSVSISLNSIDILERTFMFRSASKQKRGSRLHADRP